MRAKGELYRPKVFGSTIVSPRGQVVIPANARKELDIEAGDVLLVCGPPHGRGLLLLKVDAVEEMLGIISEQLTAFERLVQDYKLPKAAGREEALG